MSDYHTNSTYIVPVTIRDRTDDLLDLSTADITYRVTTRQGGNDELLTVTDGDSEFTATDLEDGEFEIEIPPSQNDFQGNVWEEVRVTFPGEDRSAVVVQREVYFQGVSTSA